MSSRLDAVEKRIEYRRLTDLGRKQVELLYVCCKACMRAELRAMVTDDPSLF